MQIPGGDLAPARRRRYGGGYGRRRRRRHLRLVATGLLVVAVAGAAYAWDRHRTPTAAMPDRLSACPTPSPTAAPVVLPRPAQVRLALLNGTSHNGLAKAVGQALSARGFVVTEAATAPAPLHGASRVLWGPGGQPAALRVAEQITGAVVAPDPHAAAGSVVVTLGSDFQRLADPVVETPRPSVAPSPCVSMQP